MLVYCISIEFRLTIKSIGKFALGRGGHSPQFVIHISKITRIGTFNFKINTSKGYMDLQHTHKTNIWYYPTSLLDLAKVKPQDVQRQKHEVKPLKTRVGLM